MIDVGRRTKDLVTHNLGSMKNYGIVVVCGYAIFGQQETSIRQQIRICRLKKGNNSENNSEILSKIGNEKK